jgi:hypothetical protein
VPVLAGRAARIAVVGRRKAGVRRRYRPLRVVGSWIALATIGVIVYLSLLSNITRVGYELARANHQRSALQEQTARLDDELDRLKTLDRLSDVAARLDMHDASTYVVVRLPQPRAGGEQERGHGLAFLTAISGWIR